MIKFIKTIEDEEYEKSTIEMSMSSDLSYDELFEEFLNFLRACGYPINFKDRLELIQDEDVPIAEFDMNISNEKVTLNLTDDEFLVLSKLAHKENLSFNEYVNKFIREEMDRVECMSEEEQDKYYEKLEAYSEQIVNEEEEIDE